MLYSKKMRQAQMANSLTGTETWQGESHTKFKLQLKRGISTQQLNGSVNGAKILEIIQLLPTFMVEEDK